MAKLPTVDSTKKYRGGKTLKVPVAGELPTHKARELLNIYSPTTWNKYLKAFDLFGRDYLSWEEFKQLLALNLFLKLKPGYTSYHQFFSLSEQGNLSQVFQDFRIDINHEIEVIKHEYKWHNERTQITA